MAEDHVRIGLSAIRPAARPPTADEPRAQARAELERIARELGADLFLAE